MFILCETIKFSLGIDTYIIIIIIITLRPKSLFG